jgi:hypothetical protein
MARVSYVATFGDEPDGQEGPYYLVVGWKRQNDRGRIVRCSEDEAEYAVLVVDGDRQEARVESLFFCPKSMFRGEVAA